MTDWGEGYRTDLEYIHTYQPHLSPLQMRFALHAAGYEAPEVALACELGFGYGIGLNIHAATSSVKWFGTDFHPAHVGFARALAAASGAAVEVEGQSFRDYCARSDLPDFDFIALHGIWSWVSDENRAIIVDFVRRKLRPGGVLSISYNTLHDWTEMLPLRDLLMGHMGCPGAAGLPVGARLDAAVAFCEALMAAEPGAASATMARRLAAIKAQDKRYVVAEYLNQDWKPMSFAETGQWLRPAGLSFACVAGQFEELDFLRLGKEQRAILERVAEPDFRQTVRDQMLGRRFRKDYWVKGAVRLDGGRRERLLRAQRVVLAAPAREVFAEFPKVGGFPTPGQHPLARALEAQRPVAIGELADQVGPAGMMLDELLLQLFILAERRQLQAAAPEAAGAGAFRHACALNGALTALSSRGEGVASLASPVVGGAVPVPRYHQLFVASLGRGRTTAQAWAEDALQQLRAAGHQVVAGPPAGADAAQALADLVLRARALGKKDPFAWARATLDFLQEHAPAGRTPQTAGAPLDELQHLAGLAQGFATDYLPMLAALQVAAGPPDRTLGPG